MYKFLQIIKYSFTSREFYRDVFFHLKGLGLKYLMLIILIGIIPVAISNYFYFSQIINSPLLSNLATEFPTINIEENKMVTKFARPYEIDLDESKTAVFTSKQEEINIFQQQKYLLIFSPDNIKIRLGGDYVMFNYSQVAGKKNIVLDKAVVENSLEMVKRYKFLLFLLITLPLLWGTELLKYVVEIAIFALVTWLFARHITGHRAFKDYYRMIVFAFYPAIIFSAFLMILPISFSVFDIVTFLLKIYFVYFALRAISPIPTKK